jgi:hypothetical protein
MGAQLFDHFAGGRLHRQRNGKTKRLCGFEIDDQFYLRALHDRQITRSSGSLNGVKQPPEKRAPR